MTPAGVTSTEVPAAAGVLRRIALQGGSYLSRDDDATWFLYGRGAATYVVGSRQSGNWHITDHTGAAVDGHDYLSSCDEARFFRNGREVLFYRDGTGWRGVDRVADDATPTDGPLEPRHRSYVLGRDSWMSRNGEHTTLIHNPTNGQRFVVPVEHTSGCSIELSVREYFERDNATGCVRVALVCWESFDARANELRRV